MSLLDLGKASTNTERIEYHLCKPCEISQCSLFMTTFCRNGKRCQKPRTTDKPRKNKIYDSGKEKHFKTKNKRTFENKKLQI
jgi:hypothetical protein